MKRKRSYHSLFAMLDLLFLCCAGFAGLFILSFVQIKEKDPNKKITEAKAEFIITYIWPQEMDCDVDSYVEDPNGALVCYRRREDGLMHLDRDDLGTQNDKIMTPYGMIEFKENREVVSIRGIIPGEYTVTAHMFAKRQVQGKVPVTIRLEKINPFKIVTVKTVELGPQYDEKTAFRFTIDKDGDILSISDLEKRLATSAGAYDQLRNEGYYEEEYNPEDEE